MDEITQQSMEEIEEKDKQIAELNSALLATSEQQSVHAQNQLKNLMEQISEKDHKLSQIQSELIRLKAESRQEIESLKLILQQNNSENLSKVKDIEQKLKETNDVKVQGEEKII